VAPNEPILSSWYRLHVSIEVAAGLSHYEFWTILLTR
jgi:hypothetical protein